LSKFSAAIFIELSKSFTSATGCVAKSFSFLIDAALFLIFQTTVSTPYHNAPIAATATHHVMDFLRKSLLPGLLGVHSTPLLGVVFTIKLIINL
jgi:hypothetical protein